MSMDQESTCTSILSSTLLKEYARGPARPALPRIRQRCNGTLAMTYTHPYVDHPPNFDAVAALEPRLQPFIKHTSKGSPFIDFGDETALRTLTEALLQKDFGINMELPNDRLCPMITGRIDYVVWVLNLLKAQFWPDNAEPTDFLGLDIGTGASCIYPLLAVSTEPRLRMVGSEIDPRSLQCAQANVQRNPHLADRIRILPADPTGPFFAHSGLGKERIDFTMCNPPFYASADEIQASAGNKALPPAAVCTGAETEMITAGGEVAFVSRMIQESKDALHIRWFSSLLGKLESVAALVKQLKNSEVINWTVGQFVQGQTKRWVLAWSFRPERLDNALVRPTTGVLKSLLPLPNTLSTDIPISPSDALKQLIDHLSSLGLQTHQLQDALWRITAPSECWSRAARRRKAQDIIRPSGDVILVSDLRVVPSQTGGSSISLAWRYGASRQPFESFWSHLLRLLQAENKA